MNTFCKLIKLKKLSHCNSCNTYLSKGIEVYWSPKLSLIKCVECMDDHSIKTDLFDERMKKKRELEEKEEREQAEKDRQAYLVRTGRTEMKP